MAGKPWNLGTYVIRVPEVKHSETRFGHATDFWSGNTPKKCLIELKILIGVNREFCSTRSWKNYALNQYLNRYNEEQEAPVGNDVWERTLTDGQRVSFYVDRTIHGNGSSKKWIDDHITDFREMSEFEVFREIYYIL